MESKYIPYSKVVKFNTEALNKAKNLRSFMERRRSMRSFSERDVPKVLIESLLMTGSSAPSGANKQPWISVPFPIKTLRKRSGWLQKKKKR